MKELKVTVEIFDGSYLILQDRIAISRSALSGSCDTWLRLGLALRQWVADQHVVHEHKRPLQE